MCGRYTFQPGNPAEFDRRFELVGRTLNLDANYNTAPGAAMPVILRQSPKRVELRRWGLIPFWAKDPNIAYHTINARGEDLAAKSSFRAAFKSQRCLVPASSFYEWDRAGKEKTPYYFKLRDEGLFAFAGLCDVWRGDDGREIKTYTIITTRANLLVGKVHPRMPVILRRDAEEVWTDNRRYEPTELQGCLRPYPETEMESYRVGKKVSDPRNNDPSLVARVETG